MTSPFVGATLVDGVPWLVQSLLILATATAAVAHPAAKLVRWYLIYRLGKQAVARCDPARIPDVLTAVTGHGSPPGGSGAAYHGPAPAERGR